MGGRAPWTLERVVNELRQLQAGGVVVSYAGLRAAGFGNVVTAAERHAGSFSRALKLAGIELVRPVWTPQRVLLELKRLHRDGVEMSSEKLGDSGHAGIVYAARRHFGSWPEALTCAGVPRYKRGPWKSWEMIRDRLRALHREGARMTTTGLQASGFADLVAAAIQEAGTWNEALRAARIPVVEEHVARRREQILDELRALHRAGVLLTSKALERQGKRKLVRAATRQFGAWANACRAAVPSFQPLNVRWTVEQLLDEIRARHRQGLPMRSTQVQKEAQKLTDAARRLGIPWRDACRRADVPESAIAPRPATIHRKWDEKLIIAELRAAARKQRPLLVRNFAGGFVSALMRRFGSWAAAIEAARLRGRYAADREAAAKRRGWGQR